MLTDEDDSEEQPAARHPEDARLEPIASYVLTTFRLKQDSWTKMMSSDGHKSTVLDWLNNAQRSILLLTMSTSGLLIPKSGFSSDVHNLGGGSGAAPPAASSFSNLDGIPRGKSVYFLKKQSAAAVTVENFHNEVLWGDLPVHSTVTTLAILFDEVFLPLLNNPSNRRLWPHTVALDIEHQMKELRNTLMELKGKSTNKTILSVVVPHGLISDVEAEVLQGNLLACDPDFRNALEGMVINWTTQIHEKLHEKPAAAVNQNPLPANVTSFWSTRQCNLQSIYEQMQSPCMRSVAGILERIGSVYSQPFNKIFKDLVLALHEAQDVSLWLSPMLRQTAAFNVVNFVNARELIDPLVHVIHLVWRSSPICATAKMTTALLVAVGNFLVQRASDDLQNPNLFNEDADEGLMRIARTIDNLEYFKSSVCPPNNTWNIRSDESFKRLNTLLKQLKELREIFKTAVCFQNLEKLEIGGLRGKLLTDQIKSILREFQSLFCNWTSTELNLTENKSQAKKFHQDRIVFFRQSDVLEKKLATICMKAFEECSNIEQMMKLAMMLGGLVHRPLIRDDLQIEPMLNKLMANDLEQIENILRGVENDFDESGLNAIPTDSTFPQIAGALMWMRRLRRRLLLHAEEAVLEMLGAAKTKERQIMCAQRTNLQMRIDELEGRIWSDWVQKIDAEIEDGLLSKVFVYRRNQLLEVNYCQQLANIIKECKYLIAMEITGIPQCTLDLYELRDEFWHRRLKLIRIEESYNAIRTETSDCELDLIEIEMQAIDAKLEIASQQVTWKDYEYPLVDEILESCQSLFGRIRTAQANLADVLQTVTLWSNEPLHRRTATASKYLDFRHQKDRFKHRIAQCQATRNCIDKLIRTNFLLFFGYQYEGDIVAASSVPLDEFLNSYPAEQTKLYVEYLKFVDDIIYKRVFSAIEISLQYLQSEMENPSAALFCVQLELTGAELSFAPTFDENVPNNFPQTLQTLVDDIFEMAKYVPRICGAFHAENMEENADLKSIAEFVMASTRDAMRNASGLLDEFVQYERLWRADKDAELRNLLLEIGVGNGFQLLERLRNEIDRYNELYEAVEAVDTYRTFNGWLAVDINPIKYALLNHICKWANLYKQWMLRHVIQTLRELDAFINTGMEVLTLQVARDDFREMLQVMAVMLQVKAKESEADNVFKPLKDTVALLKSYGVDCDQNIMRQIDALPAKWKHLKEYAEQRALTLAEVQDYQRSVIHGAMQLFAYRLNDFRKTFTKLAFFCVPCDDVYTICNSVSRKIGRFSREQSKLERCAKLLGIAVPDDDNLKLCCEEIKKIKQLWDFVFVIESCITDWKATPWLDIDTDDMENECRKFTRELRMLDKSVRQWQPYTYIEDVLKDLVSSFRVITDLQNPAITERHWLELMDAIKLEYKSDPSTTLADLLELNLHRHEEDVKNTVDRAIKEMNVTRVLDEIQQTWNTIEFDSEVHQRREIKLLKVSEQLIEILDDNQLQLQNIANSKHIDTLLPKILNWQRVLSNVDLLITHWFEVQRKWIYLESIFIGSEDIRAQLPSDAKSFELIDFEFTQLLQDIQRLRTVIKIAQREEIYSQLEQMELKLMVCEKALNNYLETKRIAFPRFYFISSADLLDILSNGNNPKCVDRHFIKLFDSILHLQFDADTNTAVGMFSKENEEFVAFTQPLQCSGRVELWLNGIIDSMRSTLHALFESALTAFAAKSRSQWVFDWPAQTALCCSQICWTADVHRAFGWLEEGYETAMKDMQKRQITQLNALINLLLGELNAGDRQKVMTICTIDVHCRDVVWKIIQSKVENSLAFQWQSQLRHRWDAARNDCFANICDAEFQYAYEYLGNTSRLVITPLTDRCYITLTQSLHLTMGGAPAGPAGTGKTETTKDLGRALGVMVYVFNCSEQMDYKSCGSIYKGLAQTGAWGCFDEFNRISVEVLSVVAVQVKTIQDAIRMQRQDVVFMGERIPLVPTVGIFITMNPGYAGRTELPENLKSLFRPCAMIVPDFALICEIMLVAEGFQEARLLARKFITLYTLCRELLSKQDHYDWGLRAIKSVLVVAGTLKRDDHSRPEDQVLMRALRDFNIPKIVTEDVSIFMGLIGDLFPALDVPRKRVFEFEKTIRRAVNQIKLQPEDGFLMKVVQLQELLDVRHSVFIVGNAGTGKTKIWQTLLATYQIQKLKPVHSVLNPKALTNDELFGIVNPTTREWKDGLFSSIMRDQANLPAGNPKWIILDGDIDPMWIESLNTLMDDNKVLTLASNERISLQKDMRLIFEVGHLKAATPATVSRAGILYINPQDLGWFPYIFSWLETRSNLIERGIFTTLFEKYFPSLVKRSKDFKKTTPIADISMIQMTCYLLECLLENTTATTPISAESLESRLEVIFVYAAIWGFGSALYRDHIIDWNHEFHNWWVTEFKDVRFPFHGTIFDYYLDVNTFRFQPWEQLPARFDMDPETTPLQNVLVPTRDTIRLQYFLKLLIDHNHPVMLVGSSGCGKGAIFREVFNTYNESKQVQRTYFNFYTTSEIFQRTLDKPLEKKSGRFYGPNSNKSLTYFVSDLNMPEVDAYGTVQPHTIIRQFMDYQQWYDRNKLVLKDIRSCQFAASMNPTSGSFTIDPRLQRHFCIFAVSAPSDETLTRIYSTILCQFLESPFNGFNKETKSIGGLLVHIGVALHRRVEYAFLPTALKFHYTFSMRDLTNIFQGMMNCNSGTCSKPIELVRFYVHEAYRVYHDRLVDQYDLKAFKAAIRDTFKKDFEDFDEDFVFAEPLIYCHFAQSLVDQKYLPFRSWKALYDLLMEAQGNYNELVGYMNLVMFEDAMVHVCRINRILESPRGNALLIGVGGSGKQTLARLASFISSFNVFQIQLKRGYCLQDMKEDIAGLYTKVGLKNISSVFLMSDAQIPDESILMLCNDMLASGEIPDLYAEDQFDAIVNGIRNEVKQTGLVDSKENCWRFFIEKVRRLLKIVLCFSPVGPTLRIRARKFPALISRTCIDWFHEWPKPALESVSRKFLSEIDVLPHDVVDPIGCYMAYVHGTVNQISKIYLQNEKRYNYTTPKTFLEYIALYRKLLIEKTEQHNERIERLENGMAKLDECALQVDSLQDQLAIQEIELTAKNAAADKLILIVSAESEKVQKEKFAASEEEKRVRIIEEDVSIKTKMCEEDLRKAEPALIAAQAALNTLNKNNLTELKSFGSPPKAVVNVCSAVGVLFATNGRIPKDRSWRAAKLLMVRVDQFLNDLVTYDKDNIHPNIIDALQDYLKDPEFNPDNIVQKSVAAAGLCAWVINIHRYHQVFLIVGPKQKALEDSQEELRAARERLDYLKRKIRNLEAKLFEIQSEFEEALAEKQKCQAEADRTSFTIDLANRLVNGLANENVRWKESVASLRTKIGTLPGDILLISSFLSYVGCFTRRYRQELQEKMWMPNFRKIRPVIPHTEGVDPLTLISDDAQIAIWNNEGLPMDRMSTENATILTNSTRWPLVIDPQLQGIKWIKNKYADRLTVLRLSQKGYLDTLERAMATGEVVLIEQIGESLDAVLEPLLSRALMKKGKFIKIGDKEMDYNPNFLLILHTKLGNPHYKPEMQAQTTLINFTVTRDGLEEQLLAEVVKIERPDLEQLKTEVTIQQNKFKISLKALEDELLARLASAGQNVLAEHALVLNLEATKKTVDEIEKKVREAKVTTAQIDETRNIYRDAAKRASILYFVLNDLSQINPIYRFSLKSFMTVFKQAIALAPTDSELVRRVAALVDSITYQTFVYTLRGLFERDKLTFASHMVLRIMIHSHDISKDEVDFLLRYPHDPNALPPVDFLSRSSWGAIKYLTMIEHFYGIDKDIENYTKRWQKFVASDMPERQTFPGEWKNRTPFQQLCIMRALRPDRMTYAMKYFIEQIMGKPYADAKIIPFSETFKEVTSFTPVLFVLSPGTDPVRDIEKLVAGQLNNISLGQGQEVVAEEAIGRASAEGHWVVLQNIHLVVNWLPSLEKLIERTTAESVHPEFKLFITAEPAPDPKYHVIPQGILEASIKIVNEPPSGMAANLHKAWDNFSQDVVETCTQEAEFKSILFALCYFHAVVGERRKFGPQGWNKVYPFNMGDLTISANVLHNYLEGSNRIPWEDLRFLFGEIMYGGHITDDWDRRLCQTYLEELLQQDLIDGDFELCPGLPAPPNLDWAGYHKYIDSALPDESPALYGLHPNAEIGFLTTASDNLLKTIFELQPRESELSSSCGASREELVKIMIDDILDKLQDEFNLASLLLRVEKKTPFVVVALQECERMNILIREIKRSLRELMLGLRGELTITTEMEKLENALFYDHLPETWMRLAYPSLMGLQTWLADLILRIKELAVWLNDFKLPCAIWLGGLFNPQSFLTAIMQESARKNDLPLDRMCLCCEVTSTEKDDITLPPKEGAFIYGLFLDGANWDCALNSIVPLRPKELSALMPVIYIKSIIQEKQGLQGVYQCPLYKTKARGETYVWTFNLKTKEPPSKWILGGVALLMQT